MYLNRRDSAVIDLLILIDRIYNPAVASAQVSSMKSSSISFRVADFLKQHAPFDAISEQHRLDLAIRWYSRHATA